MLFRSILVKNADYLMEQAETLFGITAYIDDDLPEDVVDSMYLKISKMDNIVSVEYVSKEDALNTFMLDSSMNDLFNTFKDDNPLPASFEIIVNHIDNQDVIINQLNDLGGLEVVALSVEADMFMGIKQAIQLISYLLILALTLTGMLLMTNTIKLTLHVRRKQINVMKHIGATNNFIRLPFIIEGLIIGVIGAAIPIALLYWCYESLVIFVNTSFSYIVNGFKLCPTSVIMSDYIPLCASLSILIGALGCWIAVRKYLDV